jgi:hypothetical protein
MHAQERQLLSDFLQQLVQVRGLDKDGEAEALIRQCGAQQPDALYLTVQRTLLQQQALESAQARIQQLEQQLARLQAPAQPVQPASRGFLSGLSASGWGRAPQAEPVAAATPQPAASMIGSQLGAAPGLPAGARPGWPASAAAAAPARSSAGGFLGQAAMAAAGVAGGMLLFNGIEHLMQDKPNEAEAQAGSSPAPDHAADSASASPLADNSDSNDSGGWFGDGGFFDGGGDDEVV